MRKFEKNDKIRNIIMFICLAVQFVTTLISCITDTKSWTTSLLKPWIVMLSFKSFRSTFSLIALNIKDSFVTLIFIFACVFYASLFAAFAFYSTFQGVAYSSTLGESYWNFIIMMTTENYPDIMLTAYYSSTISSIFFLAFIILIVFYLLAILLAIVFDNYKKRVE